MNVNTFIRLYIATCVTVIMLVVSFKAEGGMFLDLDIGAHLRNWEERGCNVDTVKTYEDGTFNCSLHEAYVGSENPLGIVRLGYQSRAHKISEHVDVRVHGYWEHMSSIPTKHETGIDVFMIGVRFE